LDEKHRLLVAFTDVHGLSKFGGFFYNVLRIIDYADIQEKMLKKLTCLVWSIPIQSSLFVNKPSRQAYQEVNPLCA
jgi:hypothetical protein